MDSLQLRLATLKEELDSTRSSSVLPEAPEVDRCLAPHPVVTVLAAEELALNRGSANLEDLKEAHRHMCVARCEDPEPDT